MAVAKNAMCEKLIKAVYKDPLLVVPEVTEEELLDMVPAQPVPARDVDADLLLGFEQHYGHLLCAGLYAVVANGDQSGWDLLRRHAHFTYLAARHHRLAAQQGAGASGIFPWDAASVVAQLVVFGDSEPAGWLADELTNPGTGGVASAGRVTHFEAFAVALNAVWKRREPPSNHAGRKDLGPYAEVFAEWYDSERLSSVFVRLADCHVKMSKSRAQFPVSFEGHEACWPFEFQAIWRVRCDAGLAMPTFEHDLVRNNPLFVPPPKLEPLSDPFYEKMSKALLGPAD